MSFHFDSLMGLAYSEAKERGKRHGWIVRPTRIDGEATIATRDVNRRRINVEIVDGKVAKIKGIG